MIYNSIKITLKIEWLDPEGVDSEKRLESVKKKLNRLVTHDFGYIAKDHGLKIEILEFK